MLRVETRVLVAALLPTSVCLAACGQLLGTDQYSTAEPDLPYNGFLDRLGGAACRNCVLPKCQGVLDQCAAEPQCSELLDCATHSPGMIAGCSPPASFETLDIANKWNLCFDECAAPCNVGRIWSCQRAFTRPPPSGDTNGAHFYLRYTNGLNGKPLAGLDVRACGIADADCSFPQSEPVPVTDEQGQVTLSVTWPPVSPISPAPGFVGYLELTSKTIQPPWFPLLRFHYLPVVGDYAEWAVILNGNDPAVRSLFSATTGVTIDPSLSTLSVEIHDCVGGSAPGVELEVTAEPGEEPVNLVYLDSNATPDPTLKETSTAGIAFALNISAASAHVVARLADSREVIREVDVPLRQGAGSQIGVPPAASDE
jgi:hypothetical protein